MKSIVSLTPSAMHRLHELMLEGKNPDLLLRVYISGGGCSGFQYGFAFEHAVGPDDQQFFQDLEAPQDPAYARVGVVVDPLSFTYLEGATVDYVRHLQGSRFMVMNPNAQTTCGCGSSFSVA